MCRVSSPKGASWMKRVAKGTATLGEYLQGAQERGAQDKSAGQPKERIWSTLADPKGEAQGWASQRNSPSGATNSIK
jgi:hypothetical protein